ncbi:hypothetical protein [Aurantimonas coralicida]|uniref:hypothetical protein n=1 Tax=Aurantimonas coralicida TaxID=182270 RepID=UPI001D1829AF|nr:hypothetical protein [Aurantimonas coralicida]MCC4299335.1 hypothetical protein [Aurantimonas coralicida]
MTRASSDHQRTALKTATFAAVKAGGGSQAIGEAALTRVGQPMLSLYAATHEDSRFAGIDVALDLDLIAGQPFHARALASLQGFDLTPRAGGVAAPGAMPSMADAIRLIREAHDVETAVLEGMEDGVLTPAERRRIKTEIAELRVVLAEIEAKVDAA